MEELMIASEAGKLLGLTSDAVRYHEKLGRLRTVRVERGQGKIMKVYQRGEVERFLRERMATAEGHHA